MALLSEAPGRAVADGALRAGIGASFAGRPAAPPFMALPITAQPVPSEALIGRALAAFCEAGVLDLVDEEGFGEGSGVAQSGGLGGVSPGGEGGVSPGGVSPGGVECRSPGSGELDGGVGAVGAARGAFGGRKMYRYSQGGEETGKQLLESISEYMWAGL